MIKKLLVLIFFIALINLCVFLLSDQLNLITHFLVSIFFTLNYFVVVILNDIRMFLLNRPNSQLKKNNEFTAEDHPIIKSARQRLGK